MKGIDWKLVTSNGELEETCTVEVRNSFDAFSEASSYDIESIYNKLEQSTEEVALATVPKRGGKR